MTANTETDNNAAQPHTLKTLQTEISKAQIQQQNPKQKKERGNLGDDLPTISLEKIQKKKTNLILNRTLDHLNEVKH